MYKLHPGLKFVKGLSFKFTGSLNSLQHLNQTFYFREQHFCDKVLFTTVLLSHPRTFGFRKANAAGRFTFGAQRSSRLKGDHQQGEDPTQPHHEGTDEGTDPSIQSLAAEQVSPRVCLLVTHRTRTGSNMTPRELLSFTGRDQQQGERPIKQEFLFCHC